jgi:GT2 family glycosyltransferase
LFDQTNGRGGVANNAAVTVVSVIIPCLDDTYINETMDSLARQRETEFEVIVVVDPRGGDDISSRLAAWSDRVKLRIIAGDPAVQAGGHRNRGAALSRGRHLLFVDADDVVAEGYISAMAEALESQEFVCSRQDVQTLNPWNPRGTIFGRELNRSMGFLPFSGAGTLGIRRSLFERVGGFDPFLKCYQDADLCWRIQLAGHNPPTFVADAVLYYRLQSDRTRRWRKAVVYGRTEALLYKRYRKKGMPRERMIAGVVTWIRLISRWVRRLTGEAEPGLAWETSLRFGRLQGSLRYRVGYL